jgi:hypothetical protein
MKDQIIYSVRVAEISYGGLKIMHVKIGKTNNIELTLRGYSRSNMEAVLLNLWTANPELDPTTCEKGVHKIAQKYAYKRESEKFIFLQDSYNGFEENVNLLLKQITNDSTKNEKSKTARIVKQEKIKVQRQISSQTGYTYNKQKYNARNARDVMINIFKTFANEDNTFLEKFASLPEHGKKRRYLSKSKYDLYPNRRDLVDNQSYTIEFLPGWWLGLNYNKTSIEKIIMMACEVRGVKYGSELTISL